VEPIRLQENGPSFDARFDDTVAAALLSSRLVGVEPRGNGWFTLIPGARVGMVRIETGSRSVEVRVQPKVGIARLLFLLGYLADPGWQDEDIDIGDAEDLLPAVIDALGRAATLALRPGVLQGYRTVEEALPVVRGRLLMGAQMTRQFGLPLPVEVRYDEYDADIAENQILLAACHLGLSVPRLRDDTRVQLLHVMSRLDGVSSLPRRALLPPWRPSRLNRRYDGALRLAELILRHASIEETGNADDVTTAGFVVSMWKVFEDFVTITLAEAMSGTPGTTHPQFAINLDQDRLVRMCPDLVHQRHGEPVLVVDAKYKAERHAGYPNADAYQMLAYCTALRLDRGHLIYAQGNERPRVYDIEAAGVLITAHALDLSGTPAELLHRIRNLATELLASAVQG